MRCTIKPRPYLAARYENTRPAFLACPAVVRIRRAFGQLYQAGTERHLTHSAISRNIQSVEDWCGESLFERHGPKVTLNEAGKRLSQRLGDPLQALHTALNLDGLPAVQRQLKVLVLSSMASTWLVPRLRAFSVACPNVCLSVEAGYDMVSLPPQVPLVAIRFGQFSREGLHCHRLWFDHMVAVAAPDWVAQHGKLPAHWPPDHLLRHTHEPWPQRLPKAATAGSTKMPQACGHQFNDALVLVEAAAQGCGVAWVRASMAKNLIAGGRLSMLVQSEQVSDKSAWLVCREDVAELAQVRDFFTWAMGTTT
jgi:LysR family glycine cleavage system transcriptional activator